MWSGPEHRSLSDSMKTDCILPDGNLNIKDGARFSSGKMQPVSTESDLYSLNVLKTLIIKGGLNLV